jgi:hypothetical protein
VTRFKVDLWEIHVHHLDVEAETAEEAEAEAARIIEDNTLASAGAVFDDSWVDVMSAELVIGLCGDRSDHEPHVHDSTSLGRFFCHADQTKRLPYAMERRLRKDDD